MNFIQYIITNQEQVLKLLLEHIYLTLISVGLAVLIGVPIGILISYVKSLNKPVLGIANIMQAIPSMALLGFMIPFLGIGTVPAITAVVLYSLLPIIKNTYIGIDNINPQTIEAAKGIGLTKSQILMKIQIPLALPVIMAGVRISSVTAVGFMTIAAFIGAGGLGFLVFSGIRLIDNAQILAGAVPACLLALTVDFIAATIEKLVTPISLQKNVTKKDRQRQKFILGIFGIVVALLIGSNVLKSTGVSKKVIIVGSKDYTEQQIVGNLMSEIIEKNTDIKVERKMALGGGQICYSAIQTGEIDLYMEYSGVAYVNYFNHPATNDLRKIYDTLKKDFKEKNNIEIFKEMTFNNTYTLSVTEETAEKYNLEKISDLVNIAPKLKSGTSFEFMNREDGLVGMEKVYGLRFGEKIAIDGSPKYIALLNKNVDVIDAFSTDGLLKKFNLKVLEDDRNFFPPYNGIPLVRTEVYEKYPEIQPLLEKLGIALTNEVMIELNYRVDELGEKPEDVARDFLLKNGFIK
ncbi:glycine betaine ABC transporter substrate-binding protein [Fusobacterium perfoetens]|uniref:ABC transporter permease/substrate-binding protein n=1 Tax=Fusobacterium perfoetens TaxID=852 RepID=UPI0004863574|nr:glycine betaine ABC transporter substrate-binding protein [Fusobacterium perfoetens]MCI6151685.1 ABC transporter permease subunit [Fusobacterium perfoetens]MDY3236559.1 glycine betaine ABC transporter substrate-binding protein [Fusobacterium perfoetens]